MKPEEQRIAFLEYLGWTNLNRDSKLGGFRALRGTSPCGKKNQISPNPFTNLNVIHEAVKKFNLQDLVIYAWKLEDILVRDRHDTSSSDEVWASCLIATPTQQLEAFLKTTNIWKEL